MAAVLKEPAEIEKQRVRLRVRVCSFVQREKVMPISNEK